MKPEQIQVTALPHMLVLKGEACTTERTQTDGVIFSEFSQEKVLRRFDLPTRIDVDKVEAQLQNGILEVIATKLPAKAAKRKGTSGAARSEARGRTGAGNASRPRKGRKKPGE
jgi:HSP20 family molecular chaperone IbpA